MRRGRAHLMLVALLALCADANAQAAPRFGTVTSGGHAQPITWELADGAEISERTLRLTRPGASTRSAELQLTPLRLYQLSASMARGPFSSARFSVTYVDARGQPQTWFPLWQFPNASRADGQPLSPHPQAYVQGFVLPLGASKPRAQLRLEGPDKPQLARYARWELSDLRFEDMQTVRCCERLGQDRLVGGDLELQSRAFPVGWTQWSLTANNRLELVELRDDPTHKHVLRAKPGTIAVLAATIPVPVTRGSAWRIAAQVRGQGKVELFAISLDDALPVPVRVGNSGRAGFDVRDNKWTALSTVWFAEAANIAAAQVVVVLAPEAGETATVMEIDAIELRPFQ
jgi:hypothetical protein